MGENDRLEKLNTSHNSNSEETIYKNAVQQTNRLSSSSDELVDTSDELMNLQFDDMHIINDGYVLDDKQSQQRG